METIQYIELSTNELVQEYETLASKIDECKSLNLPDTGQLLYKHLCYVRVLLDERNQIH